MNQIRINVSFDMRSPEWATPTHELYRAAIEMAAFVDGIGVDTIGLMQHHGSDDGYLPQPFTLAGGMAAVTGRVRFLLGAVILPLHDPVELAEQIAVVDLMSNGRLNVIFGAGYVPFEFAMFNKSLKDRAKLMDQGIETILRALHGERFEMEGRPIFVRPLPVQAPEDIIMVGGGVPASAKRAAKFGVGFGPMKPELIDIYLAECERLGHAPRTHFRPVPGMPLSIHLCQDPDEGWAAIERHAVHVITEYAKWAEQEGDGSNSPFKGLDNPAVLRHAGLFVAWTPDQLVERVGQLGGMGNVGFQPLLGGLSPEQGWKSLKLLEQTMPRLRQAMAVTA
ncbi:LLM class flavin-dependent oxidoreductase [Novosphingobium album (ex Liu et al. 2023)]|uniref:LLM class flavin-dependent oxidoreductase n=1 Tax=Novosphingobium album (ex Liu et al. 2023) TaxID=3031130 RepID=A0ABT5WVX6_9SPHN|nr:LLM class flavin-dependent oxidoreductase [Novosphingobium album (ex Liu et al. 2023)]MDE8654007.1 LLM class flavin-dependent oxidoreductase [Novosphingobium album (ex Liu et al. 2023)]